VPRKVQAHGDAGVGLARGAVVVPLRQAARSAQHQIGVDLGRGHVDGDLLAGAALKGPDVDVFARIQSLVTLAQAAGRLAADREALLGAGLTARESQGGQGREDGQKYGADGAHRRLPQAVRNDATPERRGLESRPNLTPLAKGRIAAL
jgi:hypothetical protein